MAAAGAAPPPLVASAPRLIPSQAPRPRPTLRRAGKRLVRAAALPSEDVPDTRRSAAQPPYSSSPLPSLPGAHSASARLDVHTPVITPPGTGYELPQPVSNQDAAAQEQQQPKAEGSLEADDDALFTSDGMAWRRAKLRAIAAFVLPALAIPLSDPLMSVVDTLCVGRYASTVHLAALGPATLVFFFALNLFCSQGMAVTALVSNALEERDTRKARRALSAGLLMAAISGVAVTVGLELFGARVLAATGAAADLVAPALVYLQIRALGLTAVFISNVSQGALLAQKDTVAPALIIGVACVVNTVLDVALIWGLGWGIAGAAWATLAAQLVECLLTVWALYARGKVFPVLEAMSTEEVRSFKEISGPLSFVYLCRMTCHMLIQLRATALSVVSVAAHQPIWSLWTFCSKTTAPLEQAALVFLPSCRGRAQKEAMMGLLLVCGTTLGLISGAISSFVPFCAPFWFTPDVMLYEPIRSVALQALASQVLLGVNVTYNGILIAQNDTAFLGGQLVRTLAICFAFTQLSSYMGWGLPGVWWALVVFFVAQCSQSSHRIFTHHMRLPFPFARAPAAPMPASTPAPS